MLNKKKMQIKYCFKLCNMSNADYICVEQRGYVMHIMKKLFVSRFV